MKLKISLHRSVFLVLCLVLVLGSSVIGGNGTGQNQPKIEKTALISCSSEALADITADIEDVLVARLREQSGKKSDGLFSTIKALQQIRSRKAVPLLLGLIDYNPKTKTVFPSGHEVQLTGRTYADTYPAILALKDIGVSMAECIKQIDGEKSGSLRETLFVKLGYRTHGKAFLEEMRNRKANSDDKKKWERALNLVPQD